MSHMNDMNAISEDVERKSNLKNVDFPHHDEFMTIIIACKILWIADGTFEPQSWNIRQFVHMKSLNYPFGKWSTH